MTPSSLVMQITTYFPFEPTVEQTEALNRLSTYLLTGDDTDVFLLKGYAGTGKTSLISALIRYLQANQLDCVLMAPTGRAAKVLSSYSGHPAFTIHKTIYRKASGENGSFGLNWNRHRNAVFIVDEASMIANETGENAQFGSGHLLEDLLEFVFLGDHCRLILMGDTAQLPPVGQVLSPALDPDRLRALGMEAQGIELTQVLRQAGDSGILGNATDLRDAIRFDEVKRFPRLKVNKVDVIRLAGDELSDVLSASYDKVGPEESKVICVSNKRAVLFNKGIRASVLYKEDELTTGDSLLVGRNNYLWSDPYPEIPFIANGDLVEVVRVRKQYEMYGFRFADVDVRFPDYDWELEVRVLLDALEAEAPALDGPRQERLYQAVLEDYAPAHTSKRALFQALRKDPWLNALQIKYGYAFTCHKAQGGQWKHVFIDQGYVTEDRLGLDYYRWLYTALTRATERVYLVNFNDECLDLAD
jgi:exodeoxyribonuclease V